MDGAAMGWGKQNSKKKKRMQAVLVRSGKPGKKGKKTRVSVPCRGLEWCAVECAPDDRSCVFGERTRK